MKKIIITMAFASFALASQAQYFAGGSLGLSSTSGKTVDDGTSNKGNSSFGFTIAPMVGYSLNEKVNVGVSVLFNSTTNTNRSFDPERKTTNQTFGIRPFMHYTFVEFGKFSVYANGGIFFDRSGSKQKQGSTTTKGVPTVDLGINVLPVLSYKLSEKISLEANLNFLNLGLTRTSTNNKDTKRKTVSNSFDFGVNSGNLVRVSNITIGFVCKL